MHLRNEGVIDGNMGDTRERDATAWRLGFVDAGTGIPKRNILRWLKQILFPAPAPPGSEKKLRPTAYLDGLRGFAAFIVYWHHNELWSHMASPPETHGMFEGGWGYKGYFRLAAAPFIRNFFSGGHIAVATFFVISGYVLTYKPLSLMQAGEHVKLLDNLASGIFRRWFRLFLPLIVTTFLYVTSWHIFGVWNQQAQPQATYIEEVWNWYAEFKNFSFLFKDGHIWVSYNPHLWTIPVEMRGSVIVFLAAISLSRATTKARLICEAALVFYFMWIVDGYYCALFMSGMLQADLDLLAMRPRDQDLLPKFLRRLEPYKTAIYYTLFVISMYLAGVPSLTNKIEDLRATVGWYLLSFLKPQAAFDYKWFYLFLAANMLVASVPRIGWLKRFFETPFCQWLGRISFALYLVHGPILVTLGDRVYFATGFVRPLDMDHLGQWANVFPLSMAGPVGLEPAFLIPHFILLPITLWTADLVTRLIDEPTVKFASWMYKRTLGGPTAPRPEDAMRLA